MDNIKELIKVSAQNLTLDNFIEMYYCLKEINDKEKQTKYKEDYIELIQLIMHYLMVGDKKGDQAYFDNFCELDFMNEFIVASKIKNMDIFLQIIKSMSNLILTIKNKASLFYIFSNNFINKIITSDDIQESSEDFLSFYVNFLKSLSLQIDTTTLQLFFQKEKNSFPLLENALKLYNHEDSMIKNVVKNIFLKFIGLSTEHQPLKEYLVSLPILKYFCFLSCRLVDMTIEINRYAGYEILYNYNCNNNKGEFIFNYPKLKAIHDDLIDEILYLNDILSINDPQISYVLLNSLLYYYICPLLLGSILNHKFFSYENTNKSNYVIYIVAPEIALYILTLLFSNIHNDSLLNILCVLLFRQQINKTIINKFINIQFSENKPVFLSNYSYIYKDQNFKEKNMTFGQYISYNFNKKFICSLIVEKNSKFSETEQLFKKYEKKFDDSTFDPYDNYENIINDVNSKLSKKEKNGMKYYHDIVSIATGIKSGLSGNEYKENVLNYLNEQNNMIQNPLRHIILEDLFKNGFEIINMGINILLYSMYYYIFLDENNNRNKSLSRKLLYYECNLLPYDFYRNKDIINKTENVIVNKEENEENNNEINTKENKNIIKDNDNIDLYELVLFKTENYELKYKDNTDIYTKDFISDNTTINNLIKLINYCHPFCSLGLLLIIYNIKYLACPIKNIENNIANEEKDIISKEIFFNKEQKQNIIKELLELIRKIKAFLLYNMSIKHIFYESFEKAWNTYQQDYAFNIKNLIIKYILTPNYICIPSSVKNVEDYPFKNDNNRYAFETLLLGYLALRDLLNNTISKEFPIENGNLEYHLGDKIILENINTQNPNYKLLKILLKTKKKNEFEESYLFMNKNCIIFGNEENDEKIGKHVLKVKNIHPLREMEICIDKSFANSMQLYFKNNNYMIECESNEKRIEIKSELEKKRNEFRKWEQENLTNLLEDDEKKYKLFLDNSNNKIDTSDNNNKKL